MTSRFTWLDHSEAERKRALDAIELFRQRETVDELGLAGIRDVFADLLVPGTSTVQSRVGYFLFVPWIYRELEGRGVGADKVARRARREEVALMKALLAVEDPAEHEGVFGRVSGERIKRMPSSVYWNGLGRLGIRLFRGSLERYQASFGRESAEVDGDPAEVADEDGLRGNWDPHLPVPPAGFPEKASIRLRRQDADYLLDRLRMNATGTPFHLVAEDDWEEDVEYPWDHPVAGRIDERMANVLEHARCFAEVMQGAALLYNGMLARALANEEWVAEYEEWLGEWSSDVEERRDALGRWDRAEFWALVLRENPRISAAARAFVERWCELALGSSSTELARGPEGERLVAARELVLKGERARLRSRTHLEQWNGASGPGRYRYRWNVGQAMAREIREGLAR